MIKNLKIRRIKEAICDYILYIILFCAVVVGLAAIIIGLIVGFKVLGELFEGCA